MYIYKHMYLHVHTCKCSRIYVYVRVCTYMYVYICMLLDKKQGDKWGHTKGRGRHRHFQDAMRILGFQSTLRNLPTNGVTSLPVSAT